MHFEQRRCFRRLRGKATDSFLKNYCGSKRNGIVFLFDHFIEHILEYKKKYSSIITLLQNRGDEARCLFHSFLERRPGEDRLFLKDET